MHWLKRSAACSMLHTHCEPPYGYKICHSFILFPSLSGTNLTIMPSSCGIPHWTSWGSCTWVFVYLLINSDRAAKPDAKKDAKKITFEDSALCFRFLSQVAGLLEVCPWEPVHVWSTQRDTAVSSVLISAASSAAQCFLTSIFSMTCHVLCCIISESIESMESFAIWNPLVHRFPPLRSCRATGAPASVLQLALSQEQMDH